MKKLVKSLFLSTALLGLAPIKASSETLAPNTFMIPECPTQTVYLAGSLNSTTPEIPTFNKTVYLPDKTPLKLTFSGTRPTYTLSIMLGDCCPSLSKESDSHGAETVPSPINLTAENYKLSAAFPSSTSPETLQTRLRVYNHSLQHSFILDISQINIGDDSAPSQLTFSEDHKDSEKVSTIKVQNGGLTLVGNNGTESTQPVSVSAEVGDNDNIIPALLLVTSQIPGDVNITATFLEGVLSTNFSPLVDTNQDDLQQNIERLTQLLTRLRAASFTFSRQNGETNFKLMP